MTDELIERMGEALFNLSDSLRESLGNDRLHVRHEAVVQVWQELTKSHALASSDRADLVRRVEELEAERDALSGLISESNIEAMANDIACAIIEPREEIVRARHSAMTRLGERLRKPLESDIARAALKEQRP